MVCPDKLTTSNSTFSCEINPPEMIGPVAEWIIEMGFESKSSNPNLITVTNSDNVSLPQEFVTINDTGQSLSNGNAKLGLSSLLVFPLPKSQK